MGEFLNSMEWYYISQEKETVPALSFKGREKKEFEEWHKELKSKLKELLGDSPPQKSL